MTDTELLKAVLSILAQAKFDIKGAELMQVAEVIHRFNEYTTRVATPTSGASASSALLNE